MIFPFTSAVVDSRRLFLDKAFEKSVFLRCTQGWKSYWLGFVIYSTSSIGGVSLVSFQPSLELGGKMSIKPNGSGPYGQLKS